MDFHLIFKDETTSTHDTNVFQWFKYTWILVECLWIKYFLHTIQLYLCVTLVRHGGCRYIQNWGWLIERSRYENKSNGCIFDLKNLRRKITQIYYRNKQNCADKSLSWSNTLQYYDQPRNHPRMLKSTKCMKLTLSLRMES